MIFLRAGPYKNGIFKFIVHIPIEYPNKAPRIFFQTRVYHPCVVRSWQRPHCIRVLRSDPFARDHSGRVFCDCRHHSFHFCDTIVIVVYPIEPCLVGLSPSPCLPYRIEPAANSIFLSSFLNGTCVYPSLLFPPYPQFLGSICDSVSLFVVTDERVRVPLTVFTQDWQPAVLAQDLVLHQEGLVQTRIVGVGCHGPTRRQTL